MAGANRTGRVSSIDYESGTYEVTYYDRGQSVTKKINAASNGEYMMPKIGQVVSVAHQSNGAAQATAIGTIWNATNKPAEGYEGLYRKEYGSKKGQAYDRYDANTGVYTQYVDKRTGRQCNGEIYDEAKGPLSMVAGGQVQIQSSGSSVGIQAAKGAGLSAGESVSVEAGTFVSMEAGGDMNLSSNGAYALEVQSDASETVTGKVTRKFSGGAEGTISGNATLTITGNLTLSVNGAQITIGSGGGVSIVSPAKVDISAPEINITGDSGDITVDGVSLLNHTHEEEGSGKPKQ